MIARAYAVILLMLCPAATTSSVDRQTAIHLRFRPEVAEKQTLEVTWRMVTSFQSPSGAERMEHRNVYTIALEPAAANDKGPRLRVRIERVVEESARYVNDQKDLLARFDSSGKGHANDLSATRIIACHGEAFAANISEQGRLNELDTDDFFADVAEHRMRHEDDALFLEQVHKHEAEAMARRIRVAPGGKLRLTPEEKTELSPAERARLYEEERAGAQRAVQELNDKYGSRAKRLQAYEEEAPSSHLYGVAALERLLNYILAPLPAEPVRPGDRWEAPVMIFLEGPMTMVAPHTLQEATDDTVTIQVESQRTLEDKPAPCADGFLRAEKLAGSYRATLVVDRQSGWPRSREAVMNLTGGLALPQHPAAGPDGTVPVTTQASITVKTID